MCCLRSSANSEETLPWQCGGSHFIGASPFTTPSFTPCSDGGRGGSYSASLLAFAGYAKPEGVVESLEWLILAADLRARAA